MKSKFLYDEVIPGSITFIGNTLGLSKALDSQDKGTCDAIGAFITTNTKLVVPTYPNGTTLDISQNSSSAILNLDSGNEIIRAYLIWGGTYKVIGKNIYDNIFDDIKFTVPNPTDPTKPSTSIVSLERYSIVNPFANTGLYSNIADVTKLVKNAGNGTYTVGEVPGTISPSDNHYNCCGWTLAVIYKNPEIFDPRYIHFEYALFFINMDRTLEKTLTDFETKPKPRLNTTRFLISAMQASANVAKDQILLGPDSSNLKPLSGPNNLADNFFGSQINRSNGYIDTSGTFGTLNQDLENATNIPGGRQGWDITNIDAEPNLGNSQKEVFLKFQSKADHYYPNALAFTTTIKSPGIVILMEVTKYMVGSIGDTFEITMNISNSGEQDANYILIRANLPYGLIGVIGSVTLDGVNQGHISIDSGFALVGLKVGENIEVKGSVQVYDKPLNNAKQYIIFGNIFYKFARPTSGDYTADKFSRSITIYSAPVDISKTSTKKIVNPAGDTVEYTITVKNNANLNVDNVVITDVLPTGLSFDNNSVYVDGTHNSSNIVTTGVSLGTMTPTETHEILFTANVNSAPISGEKYENFVKVAYEATFTTFPYNNQYTSAGYSIYTNKIIIIPNISKTANKTIVTPGTDTVEYTITITNDTSNVNNNAMTNIVLTDPLPSGLSYKTNTLTIDGKNSSGSPTTGINIPNFLIHGGTTVIKFTANVNAEPTTGVEYVNQSTLTYKFDSPVGEQTNTVNSNSHTIYSSAIVVKPNLNLSSDVSSVILGDTIKYTATITNNNATEIENSIFNNKLPNGLSFITGTLTINNTPNSATSLESNIPLGNITNVNPVVVKYSAHVDSIPNDGAIYPNTFTLNYDFQSIAGKLNYTLTSNTNTIAIDIPIRATVLLNANKIYVASIGETIEYTITIHTPTSNILTNSIYDVILSTALPSGLSFKPGSLTVNDTPSNDSLSNVSVGTIAYGDNSIVKFTTIVNSEPDMGKLYKNSVNITYKFQNATGENISNVISNSVVTYSPAIIIYPTLNLTANKQFIVLGDTVSFTATITNNTSNLIDNAIFSTQIPKGLSFVANSLIINDAPLDSDFNNPIDLGAIVTSKSIVIKYSVIVSSPPIDNGMYSNFFTINYSFTSSIGNLTNTLNSNTINLATNNSTINPLALKNMVYKTSKNVSIVEKINSGNVSSNPLSYSIQTYPSNGYVSINQKGVFKYTPKVNFLGLDKFSILINNTDIGSVTLNINILVVTNFPNLLEEFPYCGK